MKCDASKNGLASLSRWSSHKIAVAGYLNCGGSRWINSYPPKAENYKDKNISSRDFFFSHFKWDHCLLPTWRWLLVKTVIWYVKMTHSFTNLPVKNTQWQKLFCRVQKGWKSVFHSFIIFFFFFLTSRPFWSSTHFPFGLGGRAVSSLSWPGWPTLSVPFGRTPATWSPELVLIRLIRAEGGGSSETGQTGQDVPTESEPLDQAPPLLSEDQKLGTVWNLSERKVILSGI